MEKLKEHRHALFDYLSALFDQSPMHASEFHPLLLELYADFQPEKLLDFLRISPHYSLDFALRVCEERRLVREQVFLLGRMGNSKQALYLIMDALNDIHLVRKSCIVV